MDVGRDPEQGVLQHLGGLLRVSTHPLTDRLQSRSMAAQQFVEGGTIAGAGSFDQFGLGAGRTSSAVHDASTIAIPRPVHDGKKLRQFNR